MGCQPHSLIFTPMKQLFISFILLFFVAANAIAIPANKGIYRYKQQDGRILKLVLNGDEHFHFYSTLDGIPVMRSAQGSYYYAEIKGEELCSSKLLAHNADERNDEELNFVEKLKANVNKTISQRWRLAKEAHLTQNKKRANKRINLSRLYKGQKNGLVILVNFQNQAMLPSTPSEIERMFNQIGYNENDHYGSVQDYFFTQSYGQFNLSFDIAGPITVSQPYGYYGSNKKQSENDRYSGQMIIEACQLVDDQVDFSKYDWDGDGEVEQIFVVYAGYGEATGGESSTIWPHEYSLTGCKNSGDGDGPITLDGVIIDTYACSNELYGASGTDLMGIGAACHEFSHCLGLPDLYDTDYSGAFGMSYFDIMDAGGHNGPKGRGERPYGYSAFERWYVGWLELEEITSTHEIDYLIDLQDSPMAYILRNDNNENEYYIIENHQNKGWYQYVNKSAECHGLMITHIDYNPTAWNLNIVNPSLEHQHMSIIPADGDYGFNFGKRYYPSSTDLEGDLFPGSKNITALTNDSHKDVGGTLFTPNTDGTYNMNKAITDIKENNGIISFNVIFSKNISIPMILEPYNISEDGFTAIWEPVEDAESYTIELTEYVSEMPYRIHVSAYDNIHDTSYTFNNLQYSFYTYRVKANANGLSSEWSERMAVRLNTNAIRSIPFLKTRESSTYTITGIPMVFPQNGLYINKNKSGIFNKILIKK